MLIIGHRGASHAAPENTLAAVRLAIEEGADGVEIDVRLSRDNIPMVIHDERLKRVAQSSQRVGSLSAAELGALDVGSWFAPQFKGQHVPSLESVAKLIPDNKQFLIELKEGPEQAEPLQTLTLPAQSTFISFNADTLAAVRERFPQAPAYLLAHAPGLRCRSLTPLIQRCHELSLTGIGPAADWIEHPKELQAVRSEGLHLSVWTVDDPALARRWRDAGAKMLTSNRPGFIQAKIGSDSASGTAPGPEAKA